MLSYEFIKLIVGVGGISTGGTSVPNEAFLLCNNFCFIKEFILEMGAAMGLVAD